MNRIFSICAAIALGGLASPPSAQQVIPSEPTQQAPRSVPPAPPPGGSSRHRWVDMGEPRAARLVTRSTSHKAVSSTQSRKKQASASRCPSVKGGKARRPE